MCYPWLELLETMKCKVKFMFFCPTTRDLTEQSDNKFLFSLSYALQYEDAYHDTSVKLMTKIITFISQQHLVPTFFFSFAEVYSMYNKHLRVTDMTDANYV